MSTRAESTKCGKANPNECKLHGRGSQAHTQRASADYTNSLNAYSEELATGTATMETYERVMRTRITYFSTDEGRDALKTYLTQAQKENKTDVIQELNRLEFETRVERERYETEDSIFQSPLNRKATLPQPLPQPLTRTTRKHSEKFTEFHAGDEKTTITWDSSNGKLFLETDSPEDMRITIIGNHTNRSAAYIAATEYYNKFYDTSN